MKKELRVENDYDNAMCWELYTELIENITERLPILIEQDVSRHKHILPRRSYACYLGWDKDDYECVEHVFAQGYSQGDYHSFTIRRKKYNSDWTNNMLSDYKLLKTMLSRYYTHKHSYICRLFEVLDSGHELEKESISIQIIDKEFPDNKDIQQALIDDGRLKYDSVEFNID